MRITVWIKYFSSFIKKSRELCVNLKFLASFFVIIQLKIIAAKFQKIGKDAA